MLEKLRCNLQQKSRTREKPENSSQRCYRFAEILTTVILKNNTIATRCCDLVISRTRIELAAFSRRNIAALRKRAYFRYRSGLVSIHTSERTRFPRVNRLSEETIRFAFPRGRRPVCVSSRS